MDSWDATTPSPNLKFENSPAESFLSTPGDMYPPLFNASSGSTMNPLEMMTPQPVEDDADADVDVDSLADLTLPDIPESTEESGEKKPVKKRKSWGQVLPEPKTNLPPRKRAKTEDEKEQRRVERVLRNRRAAQSSRERKRLEVEALEKRNKQLEAALIQARQANLALMEQVHNLQRGSGVAPAPFRTSPTFSQELFSSQDGSVVKLEQGQSFEDILSSVSNNTVNPASLSPILTPVPEDEQEEEDEPESAAAPAAGVATTNASPDASHPAVSLGGSTPVVGVATTVAPSTPSLLAAPATSDFNLDDAFSVEPSFDADRYVIESGLLASPNSSDLEYDHLAGDDTSAFPFPQGNNFELFDINEFLHDELNVQPNGSAVADSSRVNPETQVSSEDPNQQPHTGASTYGCDDGGIAVGVN